VERDERWRGVGGVDSDAAIGAEDGVLAIAAYGCVGKALIAAGAVAGPSAAIIPAARILRDVAAERGLVANLRRSDQLNRVGKKAVVLFNQRMLGDLGQRGHCADLHAAI